jgi:hypothetical protein
MFQLFIWVRKQLFLMKMIVLNKKYMQPCFEILKTSLGLAKVKDQPEHKMHCPSRLPNHLRLKPVTVLTTKQLRHNNNDSTMYRKWLDLLQ